jgi:hypothetical protein
MYMDATKASHRRRRSISPVNITSSSEGATHGHSPQPKKRRRDSDSFTSLSSLFPNGVNPKVSEPEDDRDALIIQYWSIRDFDTKSIVSRPHDTDPTYQPCAKKYSYFEDGAGHSITKSQLDQFCSYVMDIFVTLSNDHNNLIKGKGFWKELSKGLKDAFWKEARIKFPFLRYCDDNWKGKKFIVDYYRRWYVSVIEKGQDSRSTTKIEDNTRDISMAPAEQQKGIASTLIRAQEFSAPIVRPM